MSLIALAIALSFIAGVASVFWMVAIKGARDSRRCEAEARLTGMFNRMVDQSSKK